MQTKGRAKFTCARFFVCIMASPPQAGEMPRSGISEGTRYVGRDLPLPAEAGYAAKRNLGGDEKKSFTDFRLGDR
jgi:hypothetical protein